MKTINKLFCLVSILIVTGCGSGEDSETSTKLTNNTLTYNNYNDSWDKARVYRPYNPIPISIQEIGNLPPGPVAISLHGCDGVQSKNLGLGDKYYPIFLAMQGYLVIEPDSYNGMIIGDPKSLLCYTDPIQGPIYPTSSTGYELPLRARDAEYAINKVKDSSFWDKKTLLVQGQSQGFIILPNINYQTTQSVTKWLFSGGAFFCDRIYRYPGTMFKPTNNNPTLIVNSEYDETSQDCIYKTEKQFPNVSVKLISGNFHTPIFSNEGQQIIKEFVKISQ
jgi:hypothetical protein